MKNRRYRPDRIMDYFRAEWKILAAVTVSGLIYNFGLLAGPWFEGKMAECLLRILTGSSRFSEMLQLVFGYLLAIGIVQGCRYIKRLYVRKFSNNVNRRMKQTIYHTLVHMSRAELQKEGAGAVMTKVISDADDCAEGMRKFTTEIFDTGIAMIGYIGMLIFYDWKLAAACMIFPPIAYMLAERMKEIVQKTGAAYKEQIGRLNAATLDRISNAITYRVFGCEDERRTAYEEQLKEYEHAAVRANIWDTALPPLYKVISMFGVGMILYFGSKNVLGVGEKIWTIAIFTTFLSCYTKLSEKSSKAAKLFNSVHKAQVSWKRIYPYMAQAADEAAKKGEMDEGKEEKKLELSLRTEQLGFAYPDSERVFQEISFHAELGQIIGVTGPVACGKSTFGKLFLCEYPYEGHVFYGDRELKDMTETERSRRIGYLGHDSELFDGSVEENILMGEEGDVWKWLRMVCLDREVMEMERKEKTRIGNGGVRLSGGQAARLALARTLCHKRELLILDDPFSALDKTTEEQIFRTIREQAADQIVIILSHRLRLFPKMDQVIWMNEGHAVCGTHAELLEQIPIYAELFHAVGN